MMEYIRTHTLNKLLICTMIFFNIACNKSNHLKKNDELVNIVNFFISEYKIPNNGNILISQHDLSNYDNIENIDPLNFVYIHIQDYKHDTPYSKTDIYRDLFRAKVGTYNIYYEVNKEDTIKIPNYLKWEKVKPEIRDKTYMIIDYTELQLLYNLKEKKIEI